MPDVYQWLCAGVPITLLVDLLDPAGPDSPAILVSETARADWLGRAQAGGTIANMRSCPGDLDGAAGA